MERSNRRRAAHWALVAAAGAGLGWWMFHYRGAALFAGTGFVVAMGFGLVSRHAPRLAGAAMLLGAAFALNASSTLGWAGTDVPDGSRFKASPVGLSHVLTPHQLESRTIDCGWYRASGYPAPCDVADALAFARLRSVYPMLFIAQVLALAAAGLSAGPGAHWRRAQRALAGVVAFTALGALALFAASVRPALAAIADLPVGVGGTLGTMQLALACLLLLTTALHPERGTLVPRTASGSPRIRATSSA